MAVPVPAQKNRAGVQLPWMLSDGRQSYSKLASHGQAFHFRQLLLATRWLALVVTADFDRHSWLPCGEAVRPSGSPCRKCSSITQYTPITSRFARLLIRASISRARPFGCTPSIIWSHAYRPMTSSSWWTMCRLGRSVEASSWTEAALPEKLAAEVAHCDGVLQSSRNRSALVPIIRSRHRQMAGISARAHWADARGDPRA